MVTYEEVSTLSETNLLDLYSSVGWISYTQNITNLKLAIENSLYVMVAWGGDDLVGLIRVVGDGATIIYIQDILVHPDYQKRGIGKHLMDDALEKYSDVRQKVLLTNDSVQIRQFYEQLGFQSCDRGTLVAFYREF